MSRMKKYYKFRNRFSPRLKGGETYVEAHRGYTMRQVVFLNDTVVVSNRNHPDYGFVLPAGYVDYAAFQELYDKEIKAGKVEPIKTISEKEFDRIWRQQLQANMEHWEEVKHRFPVGSVVRGCIATFYPQGVLIEMKPGIVGVADSRICRSSVPESVHKGHTVEAVVSGYQEDYQWLLLDAPQVIVN